MKVKVVFVERLPEYKDGEMDNPRPVEGGILFLAKVKINGKTYPVAFDRPLEQVPPVVFLIKK